MNLDSFFAKPTLLVRVSILGNSITDNANLSVRRHFVRIEPFNNEDLGNYAKRLVLASYKLILA